MADWSVCPHCGRPVAVSESVPIVYAPEPSRTVELVIPSTHCADEPGLLEPAAVSAPGVGETNGSPPEGIDRLGVAFPPGSEEATILASSGSSDSDPLAAPVADPVLDAIAPRDSEEVAAAVHEPSPNPATSAEISDDGSATPWLLVLLGSYASAVTLTLAWLLWQGHTRPSRAEETLPRPIAREAERLAPIPQDLRVEIGETLRVGSLEFTPEEVGPGTILLESAQGEPREEPGCLILRVRLKNTSSDQTFAPIARASVRQSDSGEAPCRIEAEGRTILSYPLALESERSIRSQGFPALEPGETAETILASEPVGEDSLSGPALWRVPLRVTPKDVVTVGVEIPPREPR